MKKLNFRKTRKIFRKQVVRASWCLLGAAFLLSTPAGALNLADSYPITPDKVKKANLYKKKIKSAIKKAWWILGPICLYCLTSPFNKRRGE